MSTRIADFEITTVVTDEPWLENCYCVRHVSSSQTLLIDPGDGAVRVVRILREEGGNLDAILITHGHHDHVGGVAGVQQNFSVPCYAHRMEYRLVRQAHTYALAFSGRNMAPLTDVRLFDESSSVLTNSWSIRAIHTPGHTTGSVCYCFEGFVFTGDTLLYQHVGRADTPGGDPGQLVLSIDRLLKELPEETVILPGHGRPWSIGEAKKWWQDTRVSPPQYKQFGGL